MPAELEKPPFAKEGNGLMGEMSWEVMDESRSGNFSMEVRGEAMDFGTDMLIDRSRDVECGMVVLSRVRGRSESCEVQRRLSSEAGETDR
jgi:hypothetical protein